MGQLKANNIDVKHETNDPVKYCCCKYLWIY